MTYEPEKILKQFLGLILITNLSCCNKSNNISPSYYYWKSTYELSNNQALLLKPERAHHLYIRFFDVDWNDLHKQAYPNAIIKFKKPISAYNVTPVVYITSKVMEQIKTEDTDSLAIRTNFLVNSIANAEHIKVDAIQIDCDWTLANRGNYFRFLKLLKAESKKTLEVTIRLHQIKYREKTGIPPADKGVLMFYNMGKVSPTLSASNSIYNTSDAALYLGRIKDYPLNLNVALPLFSWALQIRDGRLIQIYAKVGRQQLVDRINFLPIGDHAFRANKSFFLAGIYIKQNDIFKLEETTKETLDAAAQQLSKVLPGSKDRDIIYYELGNIDLSKFSVKDLAEISGRF